MEETDVIRTRVERVLKKAFEEACKANDRTASQVLRDLMREYIKDHAQGSLLKRSK